MSRQTKNERRDYVSVDEKILSLAYMIIKCNIKIKYHVFNESTLNYYALACY